METSAAYEKAVHKLCQSAQNKFDDDLEWLGLTVRLLAERAKQEEVARNMGALDPRQVINIVNASFTSQVIHSMINDPNGTFKSFFRLNIANGAD
jgi:hypothetical protein